MLFPLSEILQRSLHYARCLGNGWLDDWMSAFYPGCLDGGWLYVYIMLTVLVTTDYMSEHAGCPCVGWLDRMGWSMLTTFCGPTAATVRGCDRKDEQNPQGGRPSNGVNVVLGRPLLPWTWLATVSSLRALTEYYNMKILKYLSQ